MFGYVDKIGTSDDLWEGKMAATSDMKVWVAAALKSMGGVGWSREVAKYIWDNHEVEIKR